MCISSNYYNVMIAVSRPYSGVFDNQISICKPSMDLAVVCVCVRACVCECACVRV